MENFWVRVGPSKVTPDLGVVSIPSPHHAQDKLFLSWVQNEPTAPRKCSCLSISKDFHQQSQSVVLRQKESTFCPSHERKFGKRTISVLHKILFWVQKSFLHLILLHICLMGFWLSFDRLLSSGLIQNCETPDVPKNLGEHGLSFAKSCRRFWGNLIQNVLPSPIWILHWALYFFLAK